MPFIAVKQYGGHASRSSPKHILFKVVAYVKHARWRNVESSQCALKDLARRLGRTAINRENNRFEVMTELQVGKQWPESLIPVGNHGKAIAPYLQALQCR